MWLHADVTNLRFCGVHSSACLQNLNMGGEWAVVEPPLPTPACDYGLVFLFSLVLRAGFLMHCGWVGERGRNGWHTEQDSRLHRTMDFWVGVSAADSMCVPSDGSMLVLGSCFQQGQACHCSLCCCCHVLNWRSCRTVNMPCAQWVHERSFRACRGLHESSHSRSYMLMSSTCYGCVRQAATGSCADGCCVVAGGCGL